MANLDPTEPIREMAADFPEVDQGTSCNQSSFKAGGRSFLFIGPGAKGIGYKAMFKLNESMPQAESLSSEQPDRFEVGNRLGDVALLCRRTAPKVDLGIVVEGELRDQHAVKVI